MEASVDPSGYLFRRQQLWAERQDIPLIGSAGTRGRLAYVKRLRDNLFEPLSADAAKEFGRGDGGELGRDTSRPGKMQAVHSSSALGCNMFHYWRRINRMDIVLRACGVSATGVAEVEFEGKQQIDARFRLAPNLDVVVRYRGAPTGLLGIECKYSEPYSTRSKGLFAGKYLEASLAEHWREIPALRRLAERCATSDAAFAHLDVCQFLKHSLGLRRQSGPEARLLYLFYDVPGESGRRHTTEIDEFAAIAAKDGIAFSAISYQQVLLRLSSQRDEHRAWVDYMMERYL